MNKGTPSTSHITENLHNPRSIRNMNIKLDDSRSSASTTCTLDSNYTKTSKGSVSFASNLSTYTTIPSRSRNENESLFYGNADVQLFRTERENESIRSKVLEVKSWDEVYRRMKMDPSTTSCPSNLEKLRR